MTREEYLHQQRDRALELARQMLDSDEDLIVKTRELVGLLDELDAPREPPFTQLIGVDLRRITFP